MSWECHRCHRVHSDLTASCWCLPPIITDTGTTVGAVPPPAPKDERCKSSDVPCIRRENVAYWEGYGDGKTSMRLADKPAAAPPKPAPPAEKAAPRETRRWVLHVGPNDEPYHLAADGECPKCAGSGFFYPEGKVITVEPSGRLEAFVRDLDDVCQDRYEWARIVALAAKYGVKP